MANGIVGTLLILLKTQADVSGLRRVDNQLKKSKKRIDNFKRGLKGLSLAGLLFGGQRALSGYFEFEKSLGAIHSRLFAITGDADKANKHFEDIRQMSKNLGLDLSSTADAFSIFFAGTAKTLGEEGAQSMFESWSKVGRVLHFTPYQMERVTYALREMSSKGAIYSQDLKMQLGTHVPDAVGIAQEAIKNLNINGIKDLDTFQKKSKGNLQMIGEFMKEFTKVAEQRYGSPEALKKAMEQPDALMQTIKNQVQDMGIIFSQEGGHEVTVTILKSILEGLKRIDLNHLAKNLALLTKIISKVFSFFATHLPLLISSIRALIIALVIGNVTNKLTRLGKLGAMAGPRVPLAPMAYIRKGIPIYIALLRKNVIVPLLRNLLKLFGGWQGILLGIIMSALLRFGPTIWNALAGGLSKWFNVTFRGKTIEDLDKMVTTMQRMVDANKNLSIPQLRAELAKHKVYLSDGRVAVPTISDNRVVSYYFKGIPVSEQQSTKDTVDQLFQASEQRIKDDMVKQVGGAWHN